MKTENDFLQEIKTCIKCKTESPATLIHFPLSKNSKDGLHSWCKECYSEYDKQWRKQNPTYSKEWKEKNKDRIREVTKKYNENNKDKRNLYASKRIKELRKNNPQLRINHAFSVVIWRSLKKKGGSKNGYSWEKIIGYSAKDLMKHLEEYFIEGMNWDNYGKWHIDHITPISSFAFSSYEDSEFHKCWALNNLQPLWAIDNIKKGNKSGKTKKVSD